MWLLVLFGSSACFGDFVLTNAQEDGDLRKAVRRRARKLEREMHLHEATVVERTRAYFALSMFLFDLASDGSCIAQFILNGNFGFGACQALIVLVAGATEVWKGNPKELLLAFKEFRKTGVPSDRFLSILQAEKSLEAPLSFMLQFYSAFIIPSASEFAFANLGFSIAMSLYGISKGVYENLHLNMEDAFEAAEELTDSEPATPHAQLVGLPPPGMAPPHPALAPALVAPLPPGCRPRSCRPHQGCRLSWLLQSEKLLAIAGPRLQGSTETSGGKRPEMGDFVSPSDYLWLLKQFVAHRHDDAAAELSRCLPGPATGAAREQRLSELWEESKKWSVYLRGIQYFPATNASDLSNLSTFLSSHEWPELDQAQPG
eukprot:s964_g7.t3